MLSTDTFCSNEVILSSGNEISFSDICFPMISTSEDVLQLNGDDLLEILGWMGPFRNVWSSIKIELFPFANLFSILFFFVRKDNLLSIISAVTSDLFNFFCKYSCMDDVS